jgi:hypothetical protein
VVSSTIGAQGMPPDVRSALAIADDPAAFAATLVPLLTDRRLRRRAERRSARAARRLPTWDGAADALAAAYDELLPDPAAREATALSGVS